MWKFLLPFAAFVALVVLFAFGLNPNRDIHALPSPLIGKPAPAFTLTDVRDPSLAVSNAAYKGQVYVLNVWGTWCVQCRVEHEALLAISQSHVVPIIGLDYMDQRDKAKRWLEELGNPLCGGGLRHGRAHGDQLGGVRCAGDLSGRRAGAGDLQIHLADDAGSMGTRIPAANRRRSPGRRMKPRRPALSLPAIILALIAAGVCSAAPPDMDANGQLKDQALQSRFERITKDLRCLVCQNESIADSNVELAGDLRRQVREMLADGKSDDAIFNFMTDRYGEFVRFNPPLEPKTWALFGVRPSSCCCWAASSSFAWCGTARACRWMTDPQSDRK